MAKKKIDYIAVLLSAFPDARDIEGGFEIDAGKVTVRVTENDRAQVEALVKSYIKMGMYEDANSTFPE